MFIARELKIKIITFEIFFTYTTSNIEGPSEGQFGSLRSAA